VRESDLVQLAAERHITSEFLIELLDLTAPDACGRCADSAESLAALANAQAATQSCETAIELQAIGRG
jgi:hypothetical protein